MAAAEGVANDEAALHFEDRPDLLHPTAKLLARGRLQPVRMGRLHPLARCFPGKCIALLAPDQHLVTMSLHHVIEICASTCAMPEVVPARWKAGRVALTPAAMQERLTYTFTQAGMLARPRTLAQWRQETEARLAKVADHLVVDDSCFFDLEDMYFSRQCPELEDWPLASLNGGSRLMHSCGELIGYTGPIWFEADRDREEHAATIVAFLYDTLLETVLHSEPAVRRMPWVVRMRKLGEVFVRSRMPEEFQRDLVTQADLYDDISARIVLWEAPSTQAVAKLVATRMTEVMSHSKFKLLKSFAGDQTPLNAHLHAELQRLTGVAQYRALGKTSEAARKVTPLASVVQLEQLTCFLERMNAVWSTARSRELSLHDRVTMLLEEEELSFKAEAYGKSTGALPSKSNAGDVLGAESIPTSFPQDMHDFLMAELNSKVFRELEEQLIACRDGLGVPNLSQEQEKVRQTTGLPSFYMPLKLIMGSECALMKKFVLGRKLRPIATRPIFTYLDALRDEWEGFASLRMIWNEVTEVTTDMLGFKAKDKLLNLLRVGKFAELNVFDGIYSVFMKAVKHKKRPDELRRSELTISERTRSKYQFYMDRALSTVGFRSVETSGGVPDSHSSIMDAVGDFLEEGEALEGSSERMVHEHALSILDQAELAAQKRFMTFLTSTSPSFPFPAPFLAKDSLAKHLLNQRLTQMDTLIKMRGFNPTLFDGQKEKPASSPGM
jgi:hypothetical protein